MFVPAVARADGETGPARDEVVREVVRMLEAGVTEEVILRWLDREGRRPGALEPEDLIALTRAEASERLIGELMETPRPASETPRSEPVSSVAPAQPAPGRPVVAHEGAVPVDFSIRYRPYRDSEADEDEQWHLFVYLDGLPLAWSDGKNRLSRSKRTVEVHTEVAAGRHVVRLVQERHQRRGRDAWRHEARVCPDAIEFEAHAGRHRVEIHVTEPAGLGLRGGGEFFWSLRDPGRPRDEDVALAGPPGNWPPVCEEIESAYAEGQKIPRRALKRLERCVRWDSLWPGLPDVPDRTEVRALLERYDFRPPVASN
jgi:hypothetical protein